MLTFTREPPEGWTGHTGRIDAALSPARGPSDGDRVHLRLERLRGGREPLLLERGFERRRVRTERFGPTGQSH